MSLLKEVKQKQEQGLLDYKWEVRRYLSQAKNKRHHPDLIYVVVSPFIYLTTNRRKIDADRSLSAICQLCTESAHIVEIEHRDSQLHEYAKLFNQLVNSDRTLHMCYDCGTVARGVFFQLIKRYRGKLVLTPTEKKRLKETFYMNRYQGTDGIDVFKHETQTIKSDCLWICALQLGNDFGHTFIVEKIYFDGIPRYRVYQSSFNAFLLLDYIEYMDYARDLRSGIKVEELITTLYRLLSHPVWASKEIEAFIQWFNFYPSSGEKKADPKLFTSAYIILGK